MLLFGLPSCSEFMLCIPRALMSPRRASIGADGLMSLANSASRSASSSFDAQNSKCRSLAIWTVTACCGADADAAAEASDVELMVFYFGLNMRYCSLIVYKMDFKRS